MTTNNHYIAGWNTPDDWDLFKNELVIDGTPDKWEKSYSDYLIPRLNLRYLNPVKILQENGTFQGEGFSIMTILCSLVEFLESTYQGKIYRYVQRGQQLGPNQYSSSKTMFVSFLENRVPFKNEFINGLATEFYSSIRCGLLHEATTKNGWKFRLNHLMEKSSITQKKLSSEMILRKLLINTLKNMVKDSKHHQICKDHL